VYVCVEKEPLVAAFQLADRVMKPFFPLVSSALYFSFFP
jgi:hypothetical protein